nr:hypothetical protein BaRGS_020063 [Batillaria attramentaria]
MDWHYRGEGNCSLVVADPRRKKVYRLLKQNYTKKFNGLLSDTDPQTKAKAIYMDLAQVVSYMRFVMQPLLSPNYVVLPKLTSVDQDFIIDVVKQTSSQRPARRLKKPGDRVDEDLRSALLLPDFCFVPHTESLLNSDLHRSTISIEIKPKKSFIIASSDFEEDAEQSGVCKFCMHQHLKCQAGEWPETSDYCPLDLFSGNRKRMRHALQSLMKTPQNNLKIWKDGVEIYSSETKEDLSSILHNWFEDLALKKTRAVCSFLDLVIEILLMSVSVDDSPPHSELTRSPTLQRCQSSSFSFGRNGLSVCQWLTQGSVLERVYAAQLLDDLDVMGVYPLYQKLVQRMSENPQLRSEWGFGGQFPEDWLLDSDAFQSLQPGSELWAVQKVKRFLVSKTLQDCSIMVAVLPLTDSEADQCASRAYHGNNILMFDQRWYKVSVALVDLDPKPLDKIPTYYRQTSEILASFQDTITSEFSAKD